MRWYTAAEILTHTSPDTMWFLYPLAAAGNLTILSGPPKEAGKTTLLLTALRAVLRGEDFLGRPTAYSPVLYLTEQGPHTFRVQIDRAGLGGHEDLHICHRNDLQDLDWPDVVANVREKACHVGALIVIVDTLAEILDLPQSDENTAGAIRKGLTPLRELSNDGFAVILGWHDRKMGGSAVQAVRGNSALPGGVDIVAQLRGSRRGPNIRVLSVRGRVDLPDDPLYVEYHKPTATYSLVDGAQEDVLDLLPETFTPQDVEALGVSRRTVFRTLREMLNSGQITRTHRGSYNRSGT